MSGCMVTRLGGAARRVRGCALALVLAAMTAACAGRPMSGAEARAATPAQRFENACFAYVISHTNYSRAADCMDEASRLAGPAPGVAAAPLASAAPAPMPAAFLTPLGGARGRASVSPFAIDAADASCRMKIGYSMSNDRRTAFVHIDGVMADACAHRIVAMFGRLDRDYPSSQPVLVVNSPGGSVAWAEKLGSVVAKARLPVMVPPGATCASACFLVLAASPLKMVARTARVGVHSASAPHGRETLASEGVTTQIARDCAALGVPSEIIGHMIVTRPGAIYWLSPAELASMGARLVPS